MVGRPRGLGVGVGELLEHQPYHRTAAPHDGVPG
jgi:hypothetical protein